MENTPFTAKPAASLPGQDPPPPVEGVAPARPAGLSTSTLIMVLLLASLGMGLAAVVVFYLVMRTRADVWPPAGAPALPAGLWVSTSILLLSSATLHGALRAIRRGRQRLLRIGLLATVLLAVAFLVAQVLNWRAAVAAGLPPRQDMYGVTFYLITGTHALHVFGGLVALSTITVMAWLGRFTSTRHVGVANCTMFWHFIDAAWLVMFGLLLTGSR